MIPLSRNFVKQRDVYSPSGQIPRPLQPNVHRSKCKIHFCLPEHRHCVIFFPFLFLQQYWHNMLFLLLHLEKFLACTSVKHKIPFVESTHKTKPHLYQTSLLSCPCLLFACVVSFLLESTQVNGRGREDKSSWPGDTASPTRTFTDS